MLIEKPVPIIFIPGILSSQLYLPENGRKLWVSPLFLSRSECMEKACPLETRNNDADQQALPPLQREGGPMKQNILLIEKLVNAFPNRPVYYFSYDFRQSCDANAEQFAAFLRTHGFEKADVVCHSMGGLVLAAFAAKYGLDKVRRLVCLAVPFEGTPLMSQVLITGDVLALPETVSEMIGLSREVIRAYPAAADLLPSEEYQSVYPLMRGNRALSRLETEAFYTYMLPETYLSSRLRQQIRHESAYNLLLSHPESYFAVGTGKSTIRTLSLKPGLAPEEIRDFGGDGEVPYYSSTMGGKIERLGVKRFMCFDCRHAELTKLPEPLAWVAEKLR